MGARGQKNVTARQEDSHKSVYCVNMLCGSVAVSSMMEICGRLRKRKNITGALPVVERPAVTLSLIHI